MAELKYIIEKHFEDSFDTLKNCSYDKENETYMCQSDMRVVNFDKVKTILNPKKQPSSCDSLIIEEEEKKVFLVEFKNQKKSDIKNTNLQKKVKDSHNILKEIYTKYNIQKKDYDFILCVVYKSPSYAYRRFRENIIHFELETYKNKYFDKVFTNDIEFFKKEFEKKYKC